MIQGVTTKKVTKHSDERGFFAEIAKFGEAVFKNIAQVSYSETSPGVVKAFHLHDYWEIWCVLRGRAKIVFYDFRSDSTTCKQTQVIYADEKNFLTIAIPPGVGHGYEPLGDLPMGILYLAEESYDPRNLAIKNIPYDSKELGLDWKKLK